MIAHVIWSVGKRYGALGIIRIERDMVIDVIGHTHILAFVCKVINGIWPKTYAVLSELSA
jgi:hypothetical protein